MAENNLIFQIIDWRYFHDDDKQYVIRLFGMTKNKESVYAEITGFKPYFFVEVPDTWTSKKNPYILTYLENNIYPKPTKNDDGESYTGLSKCTLVKMKKFWGFTDDKLFNFLKFEFDNIDALRSYERIFKKGNIKIFSLSRVPINFKLYESNIEPFIRFMHLRNLGAMGWVQIENYKKMSSSVSWCNINITTNWKNVNPFDDDSFSPFVIASFDIECTSEDGGFPVATRDGDKITKIGTTFSYVGNSECYYKHMISLGGCSKIEGVDVESYPDEKSVLLAWTKLIQRTNPDIITGYNINGFDFTYMKDRANKLNILPFFSRLTRMKGESSEFIEKKLVSSALGNNELKYFNMTGRIIVDLLKVVQRDHRLPSYKLDFVASNFIKEEIQDITLDEKNENITTILTKSIFGIKKNQFITINYDDGVIENKYMEGKKFMVLDLVSDTKNDGKKIPAKILVKGKIDHEIMEHKYKVYWAQAKDDISPKDIFKLQLGSDDDRALISKYCIQDCELCNKLMDKLQIVINNGGMATVCSVPLTYLFERGQGVKIFSLIAKKCRQENFVIPVIKKKTKVTKEANEKNSFEKFAEKLNRGDEKFEDDEDDEENHWYEGALVIDPKKHIGVHYDPIIVMDYSSLYPSSMIYKNISHETIILDENMKKIDNYDYFDIKFRVPNMEKLKAIQKEDDEKNAHKKRYKKKTLDDFDVSDDRVFEERVVTFAKRKDGRRGIIPQILMELLDQRSKMKKKVEEEDKKGNTFKKNVYDGLQLAYKTTANSLYGQTGAPTSPVFMLDLAASTTATGREMLHFSKNFVEGIFKKMIDLAKKSKKEFNNFCDILYKNGNALDLKNKKNGEQVSVFYDLVPGNKLMNKAGIIFNFEEFKYFVNKFNDFDKFIGKFKKFKNIEEFETKFKKFEDYEEFKTIVNEAKTFDDIRKHCPNLKEFNDELKDSLYIAKFENLDDFKNMFYNKIKFLLENYTVNPVIIYGDTDSVFFNPNIKNEKGEKQQDNNALALSIQLGILASDTICSLLPDVEKQVYEKTLWPFIILTKKRYVGNLYEIDVKKYKQKSMGIVLKRRDNAPIVKTVVGGIIDNIINKRSIDGAIKFTKQILRDIINRKFPLDKFVITKTLKYVKPKKPGDEDYKNRSSIVQAVLADRMAERDPGNAPTVNDRIAYAYVRTKITKNMLQGDRVEHTDYIIKNNLKLDYLFYITNQIMKPSLQFLVLIAKNPKKIFDNIIMMENNRIKGKHHILKYFQDNKNDSDDKSKNDKKKEQIKQKQQINSFVKDINDIADMMKKINGKKIKKSRKNKETINFDVSIE